MRGRDIRSHAGEHVVVAIGSFHDSLPVPGESKRRHHWARHLVRDPVTRLHSLIPEVDLSFIFFISQGETDTSNATLWELILWHSLTDFLNAVSDRAGHLDCPSKRGPVRIKPENS